MAILRRLLVLMLVIGAGAAGYVAWQRCRPESGQEPASGIPEWPPFPADPQTTASAQPAAAADPAGSTFTWAEPVDGECPDGFPVKLNLTSGIFHVPGGRSYDRTRPDRCYASAEAATADGYRAAKA